ncbi:DNA-binding protein [Polaromonas sp. DSP2-3-2b2]|uniref:DNA-binding protein n=1 Tax=Polaromonas sp. DSP2-3-2b2 TaxID=2804662 RepID=UPI003CE8EEEE
MRPAEFTHESIIEAGQNLQVAGRNITGFALRQKVGGGNPTRLKQVWDEHQSSQVKTQAEPVADLPVEVAETVGAVSKALTERLASLAVELNDKAVKAAERRVHEVLRSAGEQQAQAERELADAAETVDDLEGKFDEVQADAEKLQTKLTDVQAINQAQAVELAQVRERITAIEAERTRYQKEVEELRAEVANHKKAAAAAAAEFDQVRTELVAVKIKAEAVQQSHQEQRKTAAGEALRNAERVTQAEADRDTARKDASSAREEKAKLAGKLEAMQAQIADLMRVIAERQPAEPKATETAPTTVKPAAKTAKKS